MRELVCAKSQNPARHDVLAFRRPRFDGGGGSVRHRSEVRASRAARVAFVGGGAMQMNNMAELVTVAKNWRQWASPRWICCVFNNEDLNQVTWEQRVMQCDPKFEASQDIPNVPYYRFAELVGLTGIYVDDPEQLGDAWEQALAAQRPVVIEVKTDPEVPPLPPHVTLEQARRSHVC